MGLQSIFRIGKTPVFSLLDNESLVTALSCGPPPLSNITDVKQVPPDLSVHPNLMCSASVCLLKFLSVLPTAEEPLCLQNISLTLQA